MVTIQTRVNDDIKLKADALFKDMGLTTTDAVRMFLVQCINQGALPFTPTGKRPNAQTLAALEAEDENTYQNVEQLTKR